MVVYLSCIWFVVLVMYVMYVGCMWEIGMGDEDVCVVDVVGVEKE